MEETVWRLFPGSRQEMVVRVAEGTAGRVAGTASALGTR